MVAVFLITLQLALQVGVPVHKHFCEMDGVFTSVLLKIDHECKEQQQANELPPCCQAAQNSCETQVATDDCCSDELEVIKTTLDQSHQDGLNLSFTCDVATVLTSTSFQLEQTNLSTKHNASKIHYRPPPLFECGRDIQTLHQVWRI